MGQNDGQWIRLVYGLLAKLGSLWVCLGFLGFLETPWGSLGFFKVSGGSLEFLEDPWGSLGFPRVLSIASSVGLNGYSVL